MRPMTDIRNATLRPATPADLDAIARLLEESKLPLAGVRESLEGFVVADHEDQLVGVAGLECLGAEYALLRSVAVEPAWRGTGLGKRLVERVIADAESRGIQALYLLTTTAERYFPSFGFTRTDRSSVPDEVKQSVEFREACPASATVMALDLAAHTG